MAENKAVEKCPLPGIFESQGRTPETGYCAGKKIYNSVNKKVEMAKMCLACPFRPLELRQTTKSAQ